MQTMGISVSRAQREIDWLEVAASAVRFVFVQATEGSAWKDPAFDRYWSESETVGLTRGAYHRGRPGGDPETQAAYFAATVGTLGSGDLPPALELDTADGHSAKHVLQWAEAFARKVESLLSRTLIILTGGFWRLRLGDPDEAFFRHRPLWLAGYSAPPILPSPWSEWTFWRYSDGTHNHPADIRGVPGPVSQSYFRGDDTELRRLLEDSKIPSPDRDTPRLEDAQAWPGLHFIWSARQPVSGPAVRLFQTRLGAAGFPVHIDGVYGPRTRVACIAFQSDQGLVADGIVGPRTWDACVLGRSP